MEKKKISDRVSKEKQPSGGRLAGCPVPGSVSTGTDQVAAAGLFPIVGKE